MTGQMINELCCLLSIIVYTTFVLFIALELMQSEGAERNSISRHLKEIEEEEEKKAVYKILQDYLDEMERDMFYRDGEYQSGSCSIKQAGDVGEQANSHEMLTVDFSSALIALKDGKRIRRVSWNVSMLLHGSDQIHVVRESGDCAEVVAIMGIFDLPFRLEDILADDWLILD